MILSTFWDENLFQLINDIGDILPSTNVPTVTKQIAGVLTLIYFSVRAYQLLTIEGSFNITNLLKPFVISMVILNFTSLVNILKMPAEMLGEGSKTAMVTIADNLEDKYKQKQELGNDLMQKLNVFEAEFHADIHEDIEQGEGSYINKQLQKMTRSLTATLLVPKMTLELKLSYWFQRQMERLIVATFKGLIYCIFFLQMILMYILATLGPISFAMSLAKPFENSWSQWVGRFLAVSFYSIIAFLVIIIALSIVQYGTEQEIERLRHILDQSSWEAFLALALQIDSYIGYMLIAIVVALAGLSSVPVATTWIIGMAGAGAGMFGSGGKALGAVAGAAGAVASGGTTAAISGGAKAMSSASKGFQK